MTVNRFNEKEIIPLTEGRTAIFGGTFNPIHYGHLRAAEEVRELLRLSKVIFIPSCIPPLKSEELVDAHHRLEMVKLAIKDNPFFEYSDIECQREGISYTVGTLEVLKKINPSMEPLFILGVDAFLDIPNWHRPERLLELCDFVIVNRPPYEIDKIRNSPYINELGQKHIDKGDLFIELKSGRMAILIRCTPIGTSASDVRRRLRDRMSIKYLLPESVESYIISNKLLMGAINM